MISSSFFRLGVWGKWMLFTVIGFIIGGLVGTAVAFVSVPVVSSLIAFIPGANNQGAIGYILIGCGIIGAAVAGAVIGGLQWLVLQQWFEQARWWILTSAVGWIGIIVAVIALAYTHVGGPVGQPDGSFVETTLWDNREAIARSVAGVLIAALIIGVLQSLALRFTFQKAGLWIVMNMVVFLIASAIMVLWVRGAGGMFGIPVFFAAYSPFYAAISGITILLLQAQTNNH
ncbi:hypothetical protein DSM106972_053970 [Dulcicalothrix desertica PCC 7102]|uniref:Uncharacterized protein n=1 Tax=Dulcicalothrix desertica PCC 7102 TaxID=232991 RepID=A0A433VAQ6_9CYAN|nr:hypothetical protein [Dulcicalothrix desertica]RUT03089.1 hypothetical protein DSM106972_053970 [Dulcicalothrix desertica PCC 7102]TWH53465.1 hypothetical protein CAL7102_01419 [Dulcicalothrix desertica PCC 7102]BDA68157.1 hypothetical protein CAL7716_023230 [Calothrix sp. PCC 7716]GJD17396.1 hypothetical protein RIVM261_023520 [Rivularia sp. IAM M-261]